MVHTIANYFSAPKTTSEYKFEERYLVKSFFLAFGQLRLSAVLSN